MMATVVTVAICAVLAMFVLLGDFAPRVIARRLFPFGLSSGVLIIGTLIALAVIFHFVAP